MASPPYPPSRETEAWAWLRRHDEREHSFVDPTSFAVMRRRRVREALAFDGDFAAAGFVEVRPLTVPTAMNGAIGDLGIG